MDLIQTIWFLLCIAAFIYCAIVDWQTMRIPNTVTYPFIVGSLFVTLLLNLWPSALFGGLLAGGIFLLLRIVAGAKKAGMGDVKLALLGGLLVGPELAVQAIFIACVVALLIYLPQILLKRMARDSSVPFGPYLAFGFIVVLLPQLF